MGTGKTSTWSNSALCFTLLLFLFFLQLTLLSDVSGIWKVKLRRVLSLSQWDISSSSTSITCDRSHDDFDICSVNSPTLFDPAQSTFFTLGPHNWAQPHFPVKIQPYPRKHDKGAMSLIKPVKLVSSPPKSPCNVTHRRPALVFSAGGYTGNFFHEFNENFIPLFITVTSLYPDRDVVLVITQGATWWFSKYAELLSSFTQHPIINTDNLTITTHCFSSATVGLMKHGAITIDPKQLPYPKTLADFRSWMENIYLRPGIFSASKSKPRLTLVSRRGNVSRVILNQDEIIKLAEEAGFNVRLLEASRDKSMAEDYKLVHTSHVLLGVHGAGLTHLLFLRPGSVLMQVVPIGLDWASRAYYGEKTSRVLGLEYMEYKVEANESSLSEKYGRESLVVKNPEGFHEGKWSKRRIYLKDQNVKLNVTRFRKYLTEAYEKAKAFMHTYG